MYHNLNTLTVFPDRLEHNLRFLSDLQTGVQAVPVLKSNAYGHGIKIIAPLLGTYDVPFVCVDSLYEAYELEKFGYKKDILIMGYVDPRDIPRRRHFIYAVSDLDYGFALIQRFSRVRLHLFLDSGMHREGIQDIESTYAQSVLTKIVKHIEGCMSHLSTPDNREATEMQCETFNKQLALLAGLGIRPTYTHIFASGGLIHHHASGLGNNTSSTLARCGIAFYGYGHPELKPALQLTTRLIQMKHIKKGESVGYDRTFTAEKDMKIGILPLGYHDGMDRRLSSVGVVMIGEHTCPILGRVSMNLTTIDLSHLDVSVGEKVIVIDENPASPVSLERQAQRAGMIPYDMLVHINKEMFRTSA